MSTPETSTRPLSPERSLYMRRAAAHSIHLLQRFSGERVEYGPTALQLLDEWIERVGRARPLPTPRRVLVVALLGQTFLESYGGYWATQMRGHRRNLGVVCPVGGAADQTRFIDIVDRVNRRLLHGVAESLALFYATVSVDLQGRF